MNEWTWNSNRIGMIIDKFKYNDQLFNCLVMYSNGSLQEAILPHKLIYPDSSLDIVFSSMEFYRDFCAANYAPIFWAYDPIEWTFDSNDGNALIIAKNQIDTDYEDHDFNLFKCVLITAGGFVERAIYRFQYQMSSDQTQINRMNESEYKTHKINQKIKNTFINMGLNFLNRTLRGR